MKAEKIIFISAAILCIAVVARPVQASEIDILVNKLVERNILTPEEARTVLEETRKEVSKNLAKVKTHSVPEWTERIKMGGDVRFRTQTDWGKGLNPAHSRIRERIRARFGLEGKVNDQVYGGARLVTGATTDPRSTNITLGDSGSVGDFAKTSVMFDEYYIRLEPDYNYLKGSKLWLGKFINPFDSTELVWDTDINPEGIGIQYTSPSFNVGDMPKTNFYANGGMMWLLEIARADTDPMMWAAQLGFVSHLYPEWETTLNLGAAFYDVTRMKNRNWSSSATAGTNSLQTAQDAENAKAYIGTLKYDYDFLDILLRLDNKRMLDIEIPNGLYADFVHNTGAPSGNTGYLFGAYVGERKIKEFGQWNVWLEWRYLERDAVPDILPDSDFYGFTPAGSPAGGGTNTKGINTGFQLGLLKNTYLNMEYYWSEPIKSANIGQGTSSTTTPYQLFQADVNVKF